MNEVLLKVEGLTKQYIVKKNPLTAKSVVTAVDNVSFDVRKGETLGLIGESGSGKTTIGSLILKLLKPDSGRIIFAARDITNLDGAPLRALRKDLQIIFQHSQDALDPKMTVDELLITPLKIHNIVRPQGYAGEVRRLLNLVGLSEKEKDKFPYQLSGGQKQRVGIARTIASRPKFVVCDEPVSALDVSIQGQILNLLTDLKQELNLTYLFISHDLKVVQHICDRIAVMHQGKIVEIGNKDAILQDPQAEYTKQLLSSML